MSVIYGDTDSIMINTRSQDLTEVKRMGEQVACDPLRLTDVFVVGEARSEQVVQET